MLETPENVITVFLYISLIIAFYVHWCFACVYVCVRVSGPLEQELHTDSCELPCGYGEMILGPLEEQPVLLIAEPSLQPPPFFFF